MREGKKRLSKLDKVKLDRKDWDDHYNRMIDNRARSITKYIKDNGELFGVLCDFVLKFTSRHEYDRTFSQWSKGIKKSNKVIKPEDLDTLIISLKDAYDKSRDDKEISDLRGRILETIYRDKLSPIYSRRNSIFGYGCMVIIDGVKIQYIDKSGDFNRNVTTIDIAGYNHENSEFYELKVRPKNFRDYSIKYLNKLKKEALANRISDIIKVGCVSLESKTSMRNQLEIVKRKYNVDYEGLEIMGKDEVRKLIEMN